MSSDRLFVGHRRRGGRPVITAAGVLTRATAMQLRTALLEALQRVGPRLILDVSELARIDEVGLDALRRTAARARLEGGELYLAAPSRPVAARLRSSGLAWQLSLHRSLADAIATAETETTADRRSGPQPGPADSDERSGAASAVWGEDGPDEPDDPDGYLTAGVRDGADEPDDRARQ